MKTKELGNISEKLLIFGGVYGNFEALKVFKEIAELNGFSSDQVICTGDISAYCAHPEECIQTIKEWGIHAISGNVEIQLASGSDDCGCNFEDGTTCDLLSPKWYSYTKKSISISSLQWMQTLPDLMRFSYQGKRFVVVHGAFSDVSKYMFESTSWEIKEKELKAAESDIILAGHSGLPFHHAKKDKAWINAGVIGMPANDGTQRVWYLEITPKQDGILFEHKSFEFDWKSAKENMELADLPEQYSKTLESGIWDNCDILPEEETQLQGKEIMLEAFTLK